MIRKTFLAIFSVLALALIFTSPVNAQSGDGTEDKGITISPIRFDYDVAPGQTVTGTVKFYNSTFSDKTIYLYKLNFKSDGVSGAPLFFTESLPITASLKDWIKLDDEDFLVKKVEPDNPNIVEIGFKITVPVDAEPGGHYAGIIATLQKPGESNQLEKGNLAFKDERAAIVLLNVKGDVLRNLDADKFYATDAFSKDKPLIRIFEWMPVGFLTELRNTGNSHTVPLGSIIICRDPKNCNGENKVAEIPFNDAEGNVLRESSRTFTSSWKGALLELQPVLDANGNEQTDQKGNVQNRFGFNLQERNIPFGRYYAKLVVGYDDDGEKKGLNAEFEFWIIPWKIILAILLILIAIIAFRKLFAKGKAKAKK